jgi:hypothetical protein
LSTPSSGKQYGMHFQEDAQQRKSRPQKRVVTGSQRTQSASACNLDTPRYEKRIFQRSRGKFFYRNLRTHPPPFYPHPPRAIYDPLALSASTPTGCASDLRNLSRSTTHHLHITPTPLLPLSMDMISIEGVSHHVSARCPHHPCPHATVP